MGPSDARPGPPRSAADWDERYFRDQAPWDTGRVDPHLAALVKAGTISACRVLEVGCGTGSDAVWMAGQGFEVTGVDLSATAITRARRRARESNLPVDFRSGSFPVGYGGHDLVYDCGCFHAFGGEAERLHFAREVARCLEPGGRWLSIIGSTDGPPRDHGPPRLSANHVVGAVESLFEILLLSSDYYDADLPTPARAWVMLARRRS